MKRSVKNIFHRSFLVIVLVLGQISFVVAKSIKVESFTSDPFDLTGSTHQRLDKNGIPCALIKLDLSDEIKDVSFEGNIIEKNNDGSEIQAYFTNGTKIIVVKIPGYSPLRLNFSNYGVYRLLSKQVYRLSLGISNDAEKNNTSQSISIHELLDKTSDGDPIDDMVNRANKSYQEGKYEEAISLLTKAADLGHPEAQLSLGILYENGIGEEYRILVPDEKKAFLYVQQSAQQGYIKAQNILSRYYLTGVGGNVNKSASEQWQNIYEINRRGQEPDENNQEDRIFLSAEQEAEFPGGQSALLKWVGDHLVYPSVAQENGIQGKVVVQFVVTKTGSIGEVNIVRSIDPALDQEAIRVVKTLPNFYPGKNNGIPANTSYILPINFHLWDEKNNKSN